MFFVIYPTEPKDWQHAMFILSYYKEIKIATFSNGTDVDTAYMVVSVIDDVPGFPEDGMVSENKLRLAEMAFQGAWHQYGEKLCPHCIDHAERFDTCGHLAFKEPINFAF
jgi:hypothetical protein